MMDPEMGPYAVLAQVPVLPVPPGGVDMSGMGQFGAMGQAPATRAQPSKGWGLWGSQPPDLTGAPAWLADFGNRVMVNGALILLLVLGAWLLLGGRR